MKCNNSVIRFINIQVCINGRKSGVDYVFGKYITMFRWWNISMFNLLISMPLASPNEMAKIIISFLNTICHWSVKRIVLPINSCHWLSQCVGLIRMLDHFQLTSKPRNVLFIAMFTCLKTTGALFGCTLSYHAELKHVYSIWGTVCLSTSVSYLCECETRAEVSATEVRQLSSIHAPQITC